MIQKITITAVESKTGSSDKGPWTKTTITGTDGLKASGFDPGLANLKPGTVIEAEIEAKGKFVNIGKFSVISQGQAPGPETKPVVLPQNGKTYGKSLEVAALEEAGRDRREQVQRASIEKQTALKELGEMIRSGKLLEREASWLLTWEHLITQMARLLVGASDKKAEGKTGSTTTISPDLFKDPNPDFKSPSEFANWWMLHGFTWIDMQGALGVKTLAEVKDLAAAHNTLAKIKAARDTQKPKTEG